MLLFWIDRKSLNSQMTSLQEMTCNGACDTVIIACCIFTWIKLCDKTTAEIDGPRRPCRALKCKYDDEALAHCIEIMAAIQREDNHKTQIWRHFVLFKVILVLFVPNNIEWPLNIQNRVHPSVFQQTNAPLLTAVNLKRSPSSSLPSPLAVSYFRGGLSLFHLKGR